ncbi:wd g-beta repeat-containing protein, partial [Cystoisospora suis]
MEGMSFSSSFLPGHDDRPTAMKESISSVEGNPVFTLQASYQCGSSPSSPNTASKCSSPFLQHVVASSDVSRLCVSSSSRSLLLFDPRTFRPVDTRHEAHTSQITDITFLSSSPSLLASSSQDGTLRLWDFRLSSSSTTTTAPCVGTIRLAPAGSKEAEVWSVAVNSSDRLIAGGCKSSFFLFDLRRSFSSFSSSPNQVSCNSGGATTLSNTDMQALSSPSSDLSTLVKRKKKNERHKGQTPEVGVQQALARIEVHSDTVTCLLFHPWLESILFSGGEDHVVCIHDVSLKKDKGAYSSPSSSSFLEGVEDTTNGPHILRSIDPTHRDTTPYARHVEEEEEDGDLTMVSCFSHGRPVKKISVLGPQDDCLCVASPMEDIALWQLAGLSAGRHACLRSPMKGSTPHGFGEADQDEECASMEAETGCATDCPFRGEMAMRSTDSYDSTDSSMWTAQGENNEVRKMHGAVHLIDKKADWLNLRLQPSLVCGESGGYLV